MTETRFDGEIVAALRAGVAELTDADPPHMALDPWEEPTPSWARSTFDPERLLTCFPRLRLRSGWRLAAFQFGNPGGVGAHGTVVALEPGTAAPTASELVGTGQEGLPGVVGSMRAIEGDRSPESYLQASILARELSELGAFWHGLQWTVEYVLSADPWRAPWPFEDQRPPSPREEWPEWFEDAPEDWRPRVSVSEAGEAEVELFVFSALEMESIRRYTDSYRATSYDFETERTDVACGSVGFIF